MATRTKTQKPEPFPGDPDYVAPKPVVLDTDAQRVLDMLGNQSDVAKDIAVQFLTADSYDALLAGGTAYNTADMVDVPFKILGVKFNDSTIDGDGPEKYGVIEFMHAVNGETGVFLSGSSNIITQVLRMAQIADKNGQTLEDVGVMTVLHNTTDAGNNVYRLVYHPKFKPAASPEKTPLAKA